MLVSSSKKSSTRREKPRFVSRDGWLSLRGGPVPSGVDPLCDQLDRPGLWKFVRTEEGLARVFEMPTPTLNDDEEEPFDPAELLTWAATTEQGDVPDGWMSPPRDEVMGWLPSGALTIAAGPIVRQGEVILLRDRLALRVPLLPRIPSSLSSFRRQWLEETLIDAQDRWRLVRVGLESQAAWAEVDLSGCPRPALEGLFVASLGALRWVVEWLAGSTAFLARPDAICRAPEVCSPAALGRGKEA